MEIYFDNSIFYYIATDYINTSHMSTSQKRQTLPNSHKPIFWTDRKANLIHLATQNNTINIMLNSPSVPKQKKSLPTREN